MLAVLLVQTVFAANTTPDQVHLALAGQDDNGVSNGMNVAWYTQDQTTTSTVKYGLNGSEESATGTAVQYLTDSGYHHSVDLLGLQSDTEYSYQVGDETGGFSEKFIFKTAPASNTASFGVNIFGDMGYLDSKVRPMVIKADGLVKDW
jgi:hypothetical protein